jgi:hypothetical protein
MERTEMVDTIQRVVIEGVDVGSEQEVAADLAMKSAAVDMVVRVARKMALCTISDWTEQERGYVTIERCVDTYWPGWVDDARAVIGEMRDITPAMFGAWQKVERPKSDIPLSGDDEERLCAAMHWQAMIDAALSE